MGCDIHAFIEYRSKSNEGYGEGVTPSWFSFGKEFHLSRDYSVFAHLAGVRMGNENIEPIAPDRGLPFDTTWEVNERYWYKVQEEEPDEDSELHVVEKSRAEEWANSGVVYRDDTKQEIADPDAHSMSWCTRDELERAMVNAGGTNSDWLAFSASMLALENKGINEVRMVFWFDN